MWQVFLRKTALNNSLFSGRCDVPLGIEDGRFPDQLITASSFYNYYCAPRNARLHQRRVGRYGGAWCARRSVRNTWIQFDFGGRTRVTRVCTQGRQNADQWVTSYYMTFSKDGQRFIPYREGRRTKVEELFYFKTSWRNNWYFTLNASY